MKYVAFDIEIATEIPEDCEDWDSLGPLGITCAATLDSDGALEPWYGKRRAEERGPGQYAPQMSKAECALLARYLQKRMNEGYVPLTINGLGFDFKQVALESGEHDLCIELALNHVDVFFAMFCEKGFGVGMQAMAEGMGIPGKPEGMEGSQAPGLWKAGEYQRVLDYVSGDVRITAEIYRAITRDGTLTWISKKGRRNWWNCGYEIQTVKQALALPEPDTSWMDTPWPRSKFYGWTRQERV